jgi:predicted Zn-dependent protease
MTKLKAGLYATMAAIIVGTCALVACVTTPVTHREQLNFVPDSQMNQMGDDAYRDMKQKVPVSSNAALTAAVTEVGKRIAQASGENYNWEFTLFQSQEINAFCLPGGKVGVYTGILPTAQSNAGLAAILGHEVAHAVLKHGAERVSQQLLVTGVLMSLEQALSTRSSRAMIMGALGLGVQFGVMLPYSRRDESEADHVGLIYMAKAGYDPHEAVSLWKRMASQEKSAPPEWLSTHPDSGRRAVALQDQLPSVMAYYDQSAKIAVASLGSGSASTH